MPIVGTRPSKVAQPGRNYMKDPMAAYANKFHELTTNMLNEAGFIIISCFIILINIH